MVEMVLVMAELLSLFLSPVGSLGGYRGPSRLSGALRSGISRLATSSCGRLLS